MIVRTNDGGQSWEQITLPYEELDIWRVHFMSHDVAFLAGNAKTEEVNWGAVVLSTRDGGDTWKQCNVDFCLDWNWYSSSCFISKNRGWFSVFAPTYDQESCIFQTKDGGDTWECIHNRSELINTALQFTDKKHGYGAWTYGGDNFADTYLEETHDGGKTWAPMGTLYTTFVRGIYQTSSKVFWTAGGKVATSRNAGQTWTNAWNIFSELPYYHRYLHAFHDDVVLLTSGHLATPSKYSLFYTNDGGSTWHTLFERTRHILNRICAVKYSYSMKHYNRYAVWVAGEYGTLLHNPDFIVKQYHASDGAILLEQNYPNPFLRSVGTWLVIILNADQSVTLTLYDIMGQKVKTLYHGDMRQGEHLGAIEPGDLFVNGQPLPSGVYFVEVESSLDRQVLKIVMLNDK